NQTRRFVSLLLALAWPNLVGSLQRTSPEAKVQATFDKALRTSDGRLLLSVLASKEAKGVSAEACSKFLTKFVKPWYESTVIARDQTGASLRLADKKCPVVIAFSETGGSALEVTDNRKLVFKTPVIKESGGLKAKVGFAQIMFAYATQVARSKGMRRAEAARECQRLVESWIPFVKKLGINGSIEPETMEYQSWDTIIKESRAEIKRMGG
ncbi:MAG: hypothetical protein ABL962_09150, partial [Fimbriimonadaceae bacterium]